ncbi:hypothetical protein [Lewinella sp. W8]|uniref:hypothetical protein n=1 Tax=Lewinella sp. W8 TaxID=2528208 RepID=UPI001067F572|nr:hypothetical protein [Lewinella sp. W8]MTB53492.1 hypothetical protein [Lewinella sp. W8]
MYGKKESSSLSYTGVQCAISGGNGLQSTAHHTIVSAAAPDHLGVPIPVVPPGSGGNFALRLGNSADGSGTEMITKTINVTADNAYYTFDYAVVLEDPGADHADPFRPTFRVRVYNRVTGRYIPNLVSMGPNGQDFVVPNSSSFFSTYTSPDRSHQPIMYSQWQCATIDLSSLIGQRVSIEFINEDCAWGAHFAYTYLDNLCGGCQLPNFPKISLNEKASGECGTGDWCFSYSAPANIRTSVQLSVKSTTGQVLLSKQSSLSNGGNGQACFSLTFDEYNALLQAGHQTVNIVATGNFSENGIKLPTQFAGLNNFPLKCPDYDIAPCCAPISNTLLAELFTYQSTGSISAPYRMEYTPTTFFNQAMQSFFQYQKALHPTLQRIEYHYLLQQVNGSAAPTPLGGAIVKVSPGINQPAFFPQNLSVNQWYEITVNAFPKGARWGLPDRCREAKFRFRVQVSTNARNAVPTLEVNTGQKTFRKPLLPTSSSR